MDEYGHSSSTFGIKILLVCFPGLFLSGCGTSLLLTDEQLQDIASVKGASTVVYYDEHYAVDAQFHMLVTTHSLRRVGKDVKSAPDYFAVYDGSTYKLRAFEGRVRHADGSKETYSQKDLSVYALSDSRQISDSRALTLSMTKGVDPGDLIEKLEVHEEIFPELGIGFSPADLGTRSENITCRIELPSSSGLHYRVLHDSLAPRITATPNGNTLYTFHWDSYSPRQETSEFDRTISAPILLAAVSKDSLRQDSWRDFGDWYLDLVREQLMPDDSLVSLARAITAGKTTNLDKLNAVFDFCERNVRYEMVYLSKGEFIPNKAPLILRRKYGDCKDYATLIYAMAHAVGVPVNLALCRRGRGMEFCKDFPVDQFNHVIAHYEEQGIDYWYDGTNRIGLPGITTIDLVNADALVLEPGNSRIVTIKESERNRLEICGALTAAGASLKGRLTVAFKSQYAIDFSYRAFFLNEARMEEVMTKWLQEHLNDQIHISNLSWKTESGDFIAAIDCEFPNALTRISSCAYTGINKLFPKLMPESSPTQDSTRLYYYPYYNHITVDVALPQARKDGQREAFHLTGSLDMAPGPFRNCEEQHRFLDAYRAADAAFRQKSKLTIEEVP